MPRELKQEPKNARARLRRGHAKASTDMALLANYRKPIEEWDIEELAHGRPRNDHGDFRGRPPVWITSIVMAEAKRRLRTMATDELAANVGDAIKVVTDLMNSDDRDDDGRLIVDARTRLDAAKFVVDHVLGKAKVRVDVDTGENLKQMLASALVMPDGKGGYIPAHPIIEGEVLEDDDDDDDE